MINQWKIAIQFYFSGTFQDAPAAHEWTRLPLVADARIKEFITQTIKTYNRRRK